VNLSDYHRSPSRDLQKNLRFINPDLHAKASEEYEGLSSDFRDFQRFPHKNLQKHEIYKDYF